MLGSSIRFLNATVLNVSRAIFQHIQQINAKRSLPIMIDYLYFLIGCNYSEVIFLVEKYVSRYRGIAKINLDKRFRSTISVVKAQGNKIFSKYIEKFVFSR